MPGFGSGGRRDSPRGRGRWACSSPSGRGSASRWRRTTARSPRTPRRSSRWRCTSRSSGSGSSTSSRRGQRSRGTPRTEAAVNQAVNNASGFFLDPAKQFGNVFLQSVLSWLIITGSFACGMAFHNTTARYLYSLGRERVLPTALGRTHEKHKSPHIASTTQSVIAALDRARVRALRHDGLGLRLGHVGRVHPAVRAHGVHGRRADPVHPGARLGGDLELLPDAPPG